VPKNCATCWAEQAAVGKQTDASTTYLPNTSSKCGSDPAGFQRCFEAWVAQALTPDTAQADRLVAIDGKTNCGSHDAAHGLGALHIVSAWASEAGVALGQVATEEKSNEITAIPLLLAQLDLTNTIITIDAMGCQKDICGQIVAGGGDFVIAVKDNQPTLRAALETFFDEQLARDFANLRYRHHETSEVGMAGTTSASMCWPRCRATLRWRPCGPG